ncbi:AI-2E family transporter [Desulfobacter vibrioformis]|uniref:AI-2E family transporter n=1 Tax=Desulfobacter vibrioformis TaxID=34031 RepID=UPI000552A3DA|nr:AI-2E family transporter [Desulfobacter vibrioformis]
MNRDLIHPSFLLLLVFFISAVFLVMIKSFLMAILLAGIFSALAYPLYQRLNKRLKGRQGLASGITIMIIIFIVLLPLSGLLGIVTTQAIKVGQTATPWVQKQLSSPLTISQWLEDLPFYKEIEPYRETIYTKAGELVGAASQFFVNGLQAATMGTMNFIFMVAILLYTMFFFLIDGDKLLEKILFYMPLDDQDERRLLDRFTSVTRATIKGTAIIGIVQGGGSGIVFALVGIHSSVFWGAVMTVLSIIPGIGTALIWIPAALWLGAQGAWFKAGILVVFCGAVAGSVDNLLRPRLVGKDTEMHDLLIFFSTLGGIAMFGIIGIIIGPIIAALFVTIWDIYGVVFKDSLPRVGP